MSQKQSTVSTGTRSVYSRLFIPNQDWDDKVCVFKNLNY